MIPVPGTRFGRWTVLRSLPPVSRRSSEGYGRARVWTKCVCGHEQESWVDDLVTKDASRPGAPPRSTGCKSARCRARHEIIEAVKSDKRLRFKQSELEALDRFVAEGSERDKQLEAELGEREYEQEQAREARRTAG